jgi:hypothetical protein
LKTTPRLTSLTGPDWSNPTSVNSAASCCNVARWSLVIDGPHGTIHHLTQPLSSNMHWVRTEVRAASLQTTANPREHLVRAPTWSTPKEIIC